MKKHILSIFLFLVSFFGFGQSGAALNFDGVNDYVNLPNVNMPFNVSAAHVKTFQLWFKNTSNQGAHVRIFSTGTANWSTGVWFGYAAGSNFLRLELSDGLGGSGVAITGTTSIRGDNLWHQATGVINGTLATLYLDAAVEGTVNISSEGAMNSAGSIHVGNSYDNEFSSYFQGNVDELRVWDKILCQPEIMATMNCELTGLEFGLVAYYKFNQGIASANNSTVTNLPDLTINANTGTLTNIALTGSTSNWVSLGGVITGTMCSASSATVCQTTGVYTLPENEAVVKILSSGNQFELISQEFDINEVSAFDLTGKLILTSTKLQQHSFKLDLTTQSKGLYFLEIKLDNNQQKTFKILCQ